MSPGSARRFARRFALITHDVDEAIYMSDRVCMMTNGPHPRVGQVLDLAFERPRHRSEVLEHPMYYDMRGCLVEFLDSFAR